METSQSNQISPAEAINKWVFFTLNYSLCFIPKKQSGKDSGIYAPRFLAEVKWNCPAAHMIEKWNQAVSNSADSRSYLTKFYCELSADNRAALLNWILENFNDEPKI